MVAPPHRSPPSIPTFGSYAVVMTWPGKNMDDVDLHVQNPQGEDAYFGDLSTTGMNLEHDDIPSVEGPEPVHHERTVVRRASPGEYTVNAMLYEQDTPGPVTVTVTLYKLRGQDSVATSETFQLARGGAEHTAFRFVLDQNGDLKSINHLQKDLVG